MDFGKFKPWRENYEDGEHYIFHFRNGYGASVIRGPYSYGGPNKLFELAVLKRNQRYPRYWDITYDTPITNDVLGWLTADEVTEKLTEISSWKKRRKTNET